MKTIKALAITLALNEKIKDATPFSRLMFHFSLLLFSLTKTYPHRANPCIAISKMIYVRLAKQYAMTLPILILIAEENDYLCQAYVRLIENEPGLQVIATAANSRDLLTKAAGLQFDILFADINIQNKEGIEACRQLEALYPHIHKIAISMYDDNYFNLQLLKAGVKGFLLKNSSGAEIINCIKQVYNGCFSCHAGTTHLVSNKMKDEEELSLYEQEVLRRMLRQQNTETIAAETFKSVSVVNHARAEIKRKLGARNDFGIAIAALQRGYVSLREL